MTEDAVLRLVHVEDDPQDRALVEAILKSQGPVCDITHVDSREGLEKAFETGRVDIVLSDDRLPTFDGQSALALVQARAPGTPFIFVSGTIGEEVAIDRLKNGATDYVLKHRLSRLPAAITRALREANTRHERSRAEAEVLRLNAELERRVIARTAELARANQALAEREEALRGSKAQLQAILDHSPSIIYLKDVDGHFLLVNRQFEKEFGVTQAEVLGKTAHDLFPPRLADMYHTTDQRALDTGAVIVEEPAIVNESVRLYASSKFPLIGHDGRPYAICGISDDITERKQAEDDLKAARLEAERANRAKSEFLSRMSHDLRTPLNAVLGFAQLLATEGLASEQLESVQQILRGGRHLLDLINEVLDIARIEAGRLSLSPEPVHVRDTVQDAVELVRPLAGARDITVTVNEVGRVRAVLADRQRLSQILLNLLSNAVKYNRPGGRVTVEFELTPADRVRIKVTDTGAGIPREKLQLLFTPFERLGAESTAIEGTGLGLALSRGLAEAMGGSIGVTSEVDVGTTFWVELKKTEESDVMTVADVPSALVNIAAVRPATVLYVEDNVSNVRLMERVLSRRPGITLLHAPYGQTGFTMALESRPDAIFLDLHLPDMSGEEVLRQLWGDRRLREIPVVVLTADATPGQMRRVMASGAVAYLTKPLDLNAVLSTLDRVLAASHERSTAQVGDGA